MPVLILLVYHGHSHFNACFRSAKLLRTRYRVVFAGYIFFEKYVTSQGFEFYPLRTVPFGLGFEAWVNKIEKKKFNYLHTLLDRWNDRLYSMREADLREMVEHLQPAYVLIDAWQSTDFVVLYQLLKRKVKTAVFHTMLPCRLKKDLPPFNSNALPDKKSTIVNSHIKFRFQAFRKNAVQWIMFFGRTNHKMIQNKIQENRIPSVYFSKDPTLFSLTLDHLPEIILFVREFEFETIHHSPREHHTGFMIDKERSEKTDTEFEYFFNEILKKLQTGCHLIYCSFGTVDLKNEKQIARFLKKLILSATQHANRIFLVAGNVHHLVQGLHLPENVFTIKFAPQLKILQHASVLITHGGLNSVKEAIEANVPILVYPINKITDNNGIAARVVYHHLGLRGNINTDFAEDISRKITSLLQEPHFKTALKKMASANDRYPENKIFDVLDSLTPLE